MSLVQGQVENFDTCSGPLILVGNVTLGPDIEISLQIGSHEELLWSAGIAPFSFVKCCQVCLIK